MAGEVLCDVFHVPHSGRMDLIARECGATGKYGEVCVAYDTVIGEVRLCPFWYGLHIGAGGQHYGEARGIDEVRSWLATEEYGESRRYTVRCLRKGSDGVRVGAR